MSHVGVRQQCARQTGPQGLGQETGDQGDQCGWGVTGAWFGDKVGDDGGGSRSWGVSSATARSLTCV